MANTSGIHRLLLTAGVVLVAGAVAIGGMTAPEKLRPSPTSAAPLIPSVKPPRAPSIPTPAPVIVESIPAPAPVPGPTPPDRVIRTASLALPNVSVNYALAANGGTATGGSNPALLIDGNDTNYDGGSGFATTEWNAVPPKPFIVTLKTRVNIDCIRFLLWDREDARNYRYKLEVSDDSTGKDWVMVADRTKEDNKCRGWQVVQFTSQTVKQIRLTGTFCNVNTGFHVIELEAYLGLPARKVTSGESLDF